MTPPRHGPGRRPRRHGGARRGLAAALLAFGLAAAAAPAAAFDLAELMTLLAQRRSGEASFTEQRQVQGLDAPLESSGTLRFDAPDRLERRTLMPRAEAMLVEGNQVTLTRGGRSRTMTLDAAPEAAAVIEAIRGTLSGDAATLQRLFEPQLEGDAAQWTLLLRPRDAALIAQVRAIEIAGRRDTPRQIEVYLADGDRSSTRIEPMASTPAAPSTTAPTPAPAAPRASRP